MEDLNIGSCTNRHAHAFFVTGKKKGYCTHNTHTNTHTHT
jgi:hypothetical protein